MDESYKEIFEAAMVCLICPTATAAAVITGKLGGSASSLTTYTLLSNILAAIAVPLIFPLVEPHTDVTFGIAFLKILSKVFPLLLAPFFIALLFRYYIPRLHKFLLKYHTSAFYLWAVALTIVMGQTTRSLVNSTADVTVEMLIAFAGLVTCCLQLIEFITKSQCMDGKWIAFGHSEGSSYFYSRGYLKYLMVEYRLFPVFIIKIRICVQIVNTGIFAKLKDKGYLNTAPAVL